MLSVTQLVQFEHLGTPILGRNAMAGPWVSHAIDKDYFHLFQVSAGDFLEVGLLDDNHKSQGPGWLHVHDVERAEDGLWLWSTFAAVQDGYSAHWLREGGHPQPGWVHLCAGPVARCPAQGVGDPAIHIARARLLPPKVACGVKWLSAGAAHRSAKAYLKRRKVPILPGGEA